MWSRRASFKLAHVSEKGFQLIRSNASAGGRKWNELRGRSSGDCEQYDGYRDDRSTGSRIHLDQQAGYHRPEKNRNERGHFDQAVAARELARIQMLR